MTQAQFEVRKERSDNGALIASDAPKEARTAWPITWTKYGWSRTILLPGNSTSGRGSAMYTLVPRKIWRAIGLRPMDSIKPAFPF